MIPVATSTRIAVDVGIVVANIDRSLSFYRDLVGLTVIAELPTSLIGQGKMVQLKHGQSLIKLVELADNPPHQSSTSIAETLGYRYMTLLVTDLKTIMTKLEKAAVPFTIPATQLPNGAKITMVTDPDGNIVEFVQESQS